MKNLIYVILIIIAIPLFGITYVHVDGSDYAEVELPATVRV